MDIIPEQHPYISSINADWHQSKVREVAMLRLDVIHHAVSGNKWYKLQHNIDHCKKSGCEAILTFGGAFSNHLVAAAAMANMCGLKSIGIVRGKDTIHNPTPTLLSCIGYGMKLVYVSREDYRRKADSGYLAELNSRNLNAMIIPEGGANEYGRSGAGEIARLIPGRFSHIAVSVGTGTTLCGMVNNVGAEVKVIGFAPMKEGAYMNNEVEPYIINDRAGNYTIYDDWHFGGFGKYNEELVSFMNRFYSEQSIPLDMVYTAKMMYGVQEQILKGMYPESTRLLCIHTGGLQGNASLAGKLSY